MKLPEYDSWTSDDSSSDTYVQEEGQEWQDKQGTGWGQQQEEEDDGGWQDDTIEH